MHKTLVMLIILGLGATKLSTFPLWESKMFKNAGNIPLWEVNVLKTLVMLIILGFSSPKVINISPVGIKKCLKHW